MEINAVCLRRDNGCLIVAVSTNNGWVEVIREKDDGTTPVMHITEESGLTKARREACEDASYRDLTASGGLPRCD